MRGMHVTVRALTVPKFPHLFANTERQQFKVDDDLCISLSFAAMKVGQKLRLRALSLPKPNE